MPNLSWLDLIATSVAPRRVIIGAAVDDDDVDENGVAVQATRNGEAVSQGVGTAVLGDQWDALRFLAEKLNERGYAIEAGDMIISGAMNPLLPATPGQYEVDFGELGLISFEITE